MAIFDLTFDLTWCRRIKAVQSHDVFERLWHKRSKVCKAVVSLNAFNARQTGVKVTDMFDLAFDRDQKHGKPIRYLIPPLTCVKGGVKVKITFALFFVKDQMYRQSHNIFETHLTLVKVWIKAMIIFDLHFDQDQIQRKSNFSCRVMKQNKTATAAAKTKTQNKTVTPYYNAKWHFIIESGRKLFRSEDVLGLNAIRHPRREIVWIGQIAISEPLLVLSFQIRLNSFRQDFIVFPDNSPRRLVM